MSSSNPPSPSDPANASAKNADAPNPYAAPGAEWAGVKSKALKEVGLGLLIYLLGLAIAVVGGLLVMIGFALKEGDAWSGSLFTLFGAQYSGPSLLVLAGILVVGSAPLLMVIGPLFCLAVPREAKARRLITAAVALQAYSLGSRVVMLVAEDIPAANWLPNILRDAEALAGWFGLLFFVLFLRRVSKYIGRPRLARWAGILLWIGVIAGLGFIAGSYSAFTSREVEVPEWVHGVRFVSMVVWLALAVPYVMLVNELRRALRP